MKIWWKIIGVLLMFYVLIAGMTIPLKPGILNSSPYTAKAGEQLNLKIKGYNSNYQKAANVSAYLMFDSIQVLKAANIVVSSESDVTATFNLPNEIRSPNKLAEATLVLDNEIDGTSILPSALSVKECIPKLNPNLWIPDLRNEIHTVDSFRFPFRNILYETIRNTFFHVAIWMAMMIILLASIYNSIQFLRTKSLIYDSKSYGYTSVAIVFGLIGLTTGAVWGKHTWGTYWTADVKLNMAAAAVLIYLAYWILRASIEDLDSKYRLSAIYNIFAFVALIPLIWIIPRLTDSLHPGNGGNPALGGEDLDNTLRAVFYPAIISLTLIGFWIANLVSRFLTVESAFRERQIN